MFRTVLTCSTFSRTVILLASSILTLPSLADTVKFTDKQFNVVDTAKKELCLLDVSDFKFHGYPMFTLQPESRASVQLFAVSQAESFWEFDNNQYNTTVFWTFQF